MTGVSGTIFDNAYFAPERPAFDKIAQWSSTTLTICLVAVAVFIIIAAFTMRPLEKAVLFAWLVLP